MPATHNYGQESVGTENWDVSGGRKGFNAIGQAKKDFQEKVLEELKKTLSKHCVSPPLSVTLTFKFYMIGRSSEIPKPTIVFLCLRRSPRKKAAVAVKEHLLPQYPGFQVGHCEQDISLGGGDKLRLLAAVAASGVMLEPLTVAALARSDAAKSVDDRLKMISDGPPSSKGKKNASNASVRSQVRRARRAVFYDPNAPITTVGLQIHTRTSRRSPEELKSAFANLVATPRATKLLTVSHIFSRKSLLEDDLSDSDSDSEDENELEIYENSIVAEDAVPSTSQGSLTSGKLSPDTWSDGKDGSRQSFSSFQASTATPTAKQTQATLDLASARSGRSSHYDATFNHSRTHKPSSDPTVYSFSSTVVPDGLELLGYVSEYSIDKDWALIDMTDAASSYIAAALLGKTALQIKSPQTPDNDRDVLLQMPSLGRVSGILSGTPTYSCLPGSATFQQVYQVTINTTASPGDSGSPVIDAVTGVLYGYVVAGWEIAGAVYIMAAHHIFEDIRSRIGLAVVPYDERGSVMYSNTSNPAIHTSASAELTRHFRDYFAEHCSQGMLLDTSNTAAESKYLSKDALAHYFGPGKLHFILSRLFGIGREAHAILPRDVESHYPQVLATLLYIGKAELIEYFVLNPDLQDKCMPFLQSIDDFPGGEATFRAFFEAQWFFCVATVVGGKPVSLHPRQILPWKSVRELGEGPYGKTFLIVIQDCHDALPAKKATRSSLGYERNPEAKVSANVSRKSSSIHATSPPADTDGSHHYVLKVRRSRYTPSEGPKYNESLGISATEGVVTCYGAFFCGNLVCIVLEWAQDGNLNDFFQMKSAPKDAFARLDLWQSYFDLVRTLYALLRRESNSPDGLDLHISPSNILVFSGHNDQESRFIFKFDYPKLYEYRMSKVQALLRERSRTYVAPECLGNQRWSEPEDWQETSAADIWSYGCVASEIATWMVRGYGGLQAYREARQDADQTMEGVDLFAGVLTFVHRHHQRLIDDIGANDDATMAVVRLIDEHLIQPDPAARLRPRQLIYKSAEALSVSQESWRLPVESAEEHDSLRPFSYGLRTPPSSTGPLITTHAPHISRPIRSTSLVYRDSSDTQDRYLHDRISPRQRSPSIEPNEHLANDTSERYSGSNRITTGFDPISGQAAVSERPWLDLLSPDLYSDDFGQEPLFASSHEYSRYPDSMPRRSNQSGLVPVLSVDEAKTWMSEEGWRPRGRVLGNFFGRPRKHDRDHPYWRQLEQDFKDRDFMILIDDSSSMSAHWKAVEECAGLLGFCTLPYSDGYIDVKFMINRRRRPGRNPHSIMDFVRTSVPPLDLQAKSTSANIETALSRVLRDYPLDMETQDAKHRKTKARTVFILTDGMWGHNDARRPIRSLVRFLRESAQPSNHIGIQFIRFGDNEEGKRRLDELDNHLGTFPDIVDVEGYPSGNVWKMLLGSINKDFDYSDRDAAMQSNPEGHIAAQEPSYMSISPYILMQREDPQAQTTTGKSAAYKQPSKVGYFNPEQSPSMLRPPRSPTHQPTQQEDALADQ